MVEIEERHVKRDARRFGPDSGSAKALELAEEWRKCEVTPIFLWDDEAGGIWVMCRETLGKRLH